jgi:hypothetical protein
MQVFSASTLLLSTPLKLPLNCLKNGRTFILTAQSFPWLNCEILQCSQWRILVILYTPGWGGISLCRSCGWETSGGTNGEYFNNTSAGISREITAPFR